MTVRDAIGAALSTVLVLLALVVIVAVIDRCL